MAHTKIQERTAMDTFVEQLRATMAERNISQGALAELTGIAQPNISRILNSGENVTLNRAEKIATALGFTLSEFLSENLIVQA